MAKNKNVSHDDAQDAINELMIKGESNSGLTFEEAFGILETADPEKMTELTSEYFTPEENKTYNFVYEGTSEAELDGKKVQVVNLRDKDGKRMVNGNAVLVNSLKRVTIIPTFVKVVTKQKQKSGNGQYYLDMNVFVLPNAVQ